MGACGANSLHLRYGPMVRPGSLRPNCYSSSSATALRVQRAKGSFNCSGRLLVMSLQTSFSCVALRRLFSLGFLPCSARSMAAFLCSCWYCRHCYTVSGCTQRTKIESQLLMQIHRHAGGRSGGEFQHAQGLNAFGGFAGGMEGPGFVALTGVQCQAYVEA